MKMMIKRMFEDCKTVESGNILKAWEHEYCDMFVFSETPRCTRAIATGQLKGSEYGTIAYSAVPALIPILRGRLRGYWY